MKKTLLFFGSILSISIAYSQVNLSIQAPPAASSTGLRICNGTTAHTTFRGHLILPASELASIPSGTTLDQLSLTLVTAPNVTAGGTVTFYLQNTPDATNLKSTTWTTAIAGMTSVYSGTYTIPAAIGPMNFVLTTPFIYTGGGLYVAYSYAGTSFATSGAVFASSAGTSIAGGVLCEPSVSTTAPATLTQSSAFRPSITFTYANPFTDNLVVAGVTPEQGKDNLLLGNTQSIYTVIRNSSSTTLTNKVVTLTVAGSNPFTATQTISSIAPGADVNLTFAGVPKTIAGSQTIKVSVPADQQTINDSLISIQNIYCDTVGYTASNAITSGVGYNTGQGIFGNLLLSPSGQTIFVKKVRPTIATGTANTGNSIKGVLLNSAGVIIDSTASYTILAANLGQPVDLTYLNGNIDVSGDSVYYGIRQTANTTLGYFPVATQNSALVLPDKFCTFGVNGGGYGTATQFGVFMIDAVLSPGGEMNLASNASNGTICAGIPLNLTASGPFANFSFIIDGLPTQSGSSTTYSYLPSATTTAVVFSSIGTCVYNDSVNVNVVTTINTGITDGICSGGSYSFAGQTLTTGGTYYDTLTSSGGCDSVVTLTLNSLVATSSSLSATICDGGSLMFGTQTISAPGTYTRTIPNAQGCDSVITITVNYQTFNTTLTQSGATLTVPTQAGASYSWIDCATLTSIVGENGLSFTPASLTGTYAAVVTLNGCSDTSTCIGVDQTGLSDMNLASFIDVFPNPTTDLLRIESGSFGILSFIVTDLNGRVILSEKLNAPTNSINFNTLSFDNGTYFLDLLTEKGSINKVFVKQ